MAGIFQQAIEGLETALSAGRVLRKGAAVTAKGASSLLNDLEKAKPNWNVKSNLVKAGITTAVAAPFLGFGGVGPLSGLSKEYERWETSQYGDSPEVQRRLQITRGASTAVGVGLLGVAGAGMFNKGPLSWDYTKAPDLLERGVKTLGKGVESVGNDIVAFGRNKQGPREASGSLDVLKRRSAQRQQMIEAPIQKFKSQKAAFGNAAKKAVSPEEWMKTPMRAGFAIGATAGLGMALADGDFQQQHTAYEGNIVGIGSSEQGGISEELRYSTQDLVFSLHKNNKSVRSRYQ